MDTRQILTTLRRERDRIKQAIAAIEAIDSASGALSRRSRGLLAAPKTRKRRRMSAAARKRISEMMKKRWAERKKRAKAA